MIKMSKAVDVYPNGLCPSIILDGCSNPILGNGETSTDSKDDPKIGQPKFASVVADSSTAAKISTSPVLCERNDYGFDDYLYKPIIDMIDESSAFDAFMESLKQPTFDNQALADSTNRFSIMEDAKNEGINYTGAVQMYTNDENVTNVKNQVFKFQKSLLENEVETIFRRFHQLSIYTNIECSLDHKRILLPRTMSIGIQIANAYNTSAEVLEAFRYLLLEIKIKNVAYSDQTSFLNSFDIAVEKIYGLQGSTYLHKNFRIVSGENVDHLIVVLDSLISCVSIAITKSHLIEKLKKNNVQKPQFCRFIGSN